MGPQIMIRRAKRVLLALFVTSLTLLPQRALLRNLRRLNRAAALPPPEIRHLDGGKLSLTLPLNALYILEIPAD